MLRAAIEMRSPIQLQSAMNAAAENGVEGAIVEKARKLVPILASEESLRTAMEKRDLMQLQFAMNAAVDNGVKGAILKKAKALVPVLATEALHKAIDQRDPVQLHSVMNIVVENGVEGAIMEKTKELVLVLATEALSGAIETRDLATLWCVMNTAGVVEGVAEALIEEARAVLPGLLAQNRLDYLQSIVADNAQVDAITGKTVRMDTEMVHVSTHTGEGASGLVTWKLAHTEEEAAQLAKATMNQFDGRSPEIDIHSLPNFTVRQLRPLQYFSLPQFPHVPGFSIRVPRVLGDIGDGTNGDDVDMNRNLRRPPATFPFELKVGTFVRAPDDLEGTIRPGPKTPYEYEQSDEVWEQCKAAENKYTVEMVADGSILTLAPSNIKVAVPITGLQLPNWDEINDTAGVARQLLKATGSPQRLLIVADAGQAFLPACSARDATHQLHLLWHKVYTPKTPQAARTLQFFYFTKRFFAHNHNYNPTALTSPFRHGQDLVGQATVPLHGYSHAQGLRTRQGADLHFCARAGTDDARDGSECPH